MAKRSLVLLTVFVSFLAVGWFFSLVRNKKAVSNTTEPSTLSCTNLRVDHLSIHKESAAAGDQDFRFIRKLPNDPSLQSPTAQNLFSTWMMENPQSAEANHDVIESLVSRLCTLSKLFAYDGGKSFEALGLDRPAYDFRLRAGAKEFLLRISSEQDAKNNFWAAALAESSDGKSPKWQLYWLPQRVEFPLRNMIKREELINRNIVKMQLGNIQVVSLAVDGKERVTLERNGDRWDVFANKISLGAGSLEADKFVNRVAKLLSVNWVNFDYSHTECERLPARYTIALEGIAGRQENIRIGGAKLGSKRKLLQACNSARQTLFEVHPDIENFLDIKANGLVSSTQP